MKWLGLIPARGGSKRCPGKNIAELGGKPLLAWTIQAAKDSGIFCHVMVSSDSDAVRSVARMHGAFAAERPDRLARDDTSSLAVVDHHARDWPGIEAIMLLQPTSPFRSAEDIEKAAGMLEAMKADSVVSVIDAPDDLVFCVGHAGRMRPYASPFVQCNGAIYGITTDALSRGEDWYSGVAYAYQMPKERSLDIDSPFDMEIARMMMEKKAA